MCHSVLLLYLIDSGKAPPLFKRDLSSGSGYILDVKSQRLAEIHQTPAKNVRGDLPTVIVAPDDDAQDAQQLAMTRSIGDFYMQESNTVGFPHFTCLL